MSTTNGKSLRFASLVRVSTEKQEQQGESLRTQRKSNERDVLMLGGRIVEWYGGQEHATEGWEKKEMVRLTADAAKGKFDAMIIAHLDRWDRGSPEAQHAQAEFKRCGIRFFVSTTEYNLRNPEHELLFNISRSIGKFQADNQRKKSMLNRIERARQGIPTAGRLPPGRTFNPKTGWGIDPKFQAMIVSVADRYLKGESLQKLATEHGVNHSGLCKTLRERCGSEYIHHFDDDDFDIHEEVTLSVPALLPEKTIKAIRQRLKINRSGGDSFVHIRHGGRERVNDYLLSGCVFCGVCGYSMVGRPSVSGTLYYAHTMHAGSKDCPIVPRPLIRANKIEGEVVGQLFRMFGNPTAIERAIKVAIPDCDSELTRLQRLEGQLAKVQKGRDGVLALIERGAVTLAEAEERLRKSAERADLLKEEIGKLKDALADVPDEAEVRCWVEACTTAREEIGTKETVEDRIFLFDDDGQEVDGGNHLGTLMTMSREDKRNLVRAVFHKPLADGKPAGVYVFPAGESVRIVPRSGRSRFAATSTSS